MCVVRWQSSGMLLSLPPSFVGIMDRFYPARLVSIWNAIRGTAEATNTATSDATVTTPRRQHKFTALENAAVSIDSQSNQREQDTEAAKGKVLDMLRYTTDARVHVADTRVQRVGLYTDFILSVDSCAEPNRTRIREYVKQNMNPELFEVFEAEHYVANEIPNFPVQHHTLSTTLVVRKHAVLLIYSSLRYWFSRLTFVFQLIILLMCLYVIVYMFRF